MIIITLSVYWMIFLRGLLVPILISVLLSILVSPITIQLEEKGLSKIASIILTIVLFLGLIAGIIYFATMQISDMLDVWPDLKRKGTLWFTQLQNWAYRLFGLRPQSQITKLQEMSMAFLSGGGSAALLKTTSTLADVILIPLYMFFMLYYRSFFCEFVYKVMAKSEKQRVNTVLFRICDVVHNYLSGLFIVMVIVGSLNTISLLILDINYAVFFGFFAALLLLIPYIGVLIGSLLPILMAFITKDSPMYGVGVAGAFLFIQFLEGNFITPYIVGSKISINPLVAIIGLLLGGVIWGIAGMMLSLPMIAILKVVFDHSESLKPFGYLIGEPVREESRRVVEEHTAENPELITDEVADSVKEAI
ncbi:AI-2E family transporter [Rhabdobacter roseus]